MGYSLMKLEGRKFGDTCCHGFCHETLSYNKKQRYLLPFAYLLRYMLYTFAVSKALLSGVGEFVVLKGKTDVTKPCLVENRDVV